MISHWQGTISLLGLHARTQHSPAPGEPPAGVACRPRAGSALPLTPDLTLQSPACRARARPSCRRHATGLLALHSADEMSHTATACLQEKDRTLERATQEALDASASAEHQHRALAKQLAEEREQLQEHSAQVGLLPGSVALADTLKDAAKTKQTGPWPSSWQCNESICRSTRHRCGCCQGLQTPSQVLQPHAEGLAWQH